MSDPRETRIDDLAQLRDVIGEEIPGVELKVTRELTEEARAFLALSPFLVLSTADAEGNLDASPKGDGPGFVHVVDDHTIVIPDRKGNRLVFGHRNILANPHVGLLFLIPGTTETVRINGRAELHDDPELLEQLAARGRPAELAIRVEIDECFFHCSKAFLRSNLWKPESWPEKQKISFGQMFAKRIKDADETLAATIDASVEEDYRVNL